MHCFKIDLFNFFFLTVFFYHVYCLRPSFHITAYPKEKHNVRFFFLIKYLLFIFSSISGFIIFNITFLWFVLDKLSLFSHFLAFFLPLFIFSYYVSFRYFLPVLVCCLVATILFFLILHNDFHFTPDRPPSFFISFT